jgi:hypothetical protein
MSILCFRWNFNAMASPPKTVDNFLIDFSSHYTLLHLTIPHKEGCRDSSVALYKAFILVTIPHYTFLVISSREYIDVQRGNREYGAGRYI